MISLFHVSFDVCKAEPGWLELLLCVKFRLIEVVRRLRIGVLSKHQDGARVHLRRKLYDADERMAGHTVTAFLVFFRTRIEIEYDPDVARRSGDGKALHIIAERLFSARLPALQPVEIAPGHAPCPE